MTTNRAEMKEDLFAKTEELRRAIKREDVASFERLIASLHELDKDQIKIILEDTHVTGKTLLHEAVAKFSHFSQQILEKLLDVYHHYSANINTLDEAGRSPLIYLMFSSNEFYHRSDWDIQAMQALLKHGANPLLAYYSEKDKPLNAIQYAEHHQLTRFQPLLIPYQTEYKSDLTEPKERDFSTKTQAINIARDYVLPARPLDELEREIKKNPDVLLETVIVDGKQGTLLQLACMNLDFTLTANDGTSAEEGMVERIYQLFMQFFPDGEQKATEQIQKILPLEDTSDKDESFDDFATQFRTSMTNSGCDLLLISVDDEKGLTQEKLDQRWREAAQNNIPTLVKQRGEFILLGHLRHAKDWDFIKIDSKEDLNQLPFEKGILKRSDKLFTSSLIKALEIGHYGFDRFNTPEQAQQLMDVLVSQFTTYLNKPKPHLMTDAGYSIYLLKTLKASFQLLKDFIEKADNRGRLDKSETFCQTLLGKIQSQLPTRIAQILMSGLQNSLEKKATATRLMNTDGSAFHGIAHSSYVLGNNYFYNKMGRSYYRFLNQDDASLFISFIDKLLERFKKYAIPGECSKLLSISSDETRSTKPTQPFDDHGIILVKSLNAILNNYEYTETELDTLAKQLIDEIKIENDHKYSSSLDRNLFEILNTSSRPLLTSAIDRGYKNIFHWLLEAKADVEAPGAYDTFKPLIYAADDYDGQKNDFVAELLANKANLFAGNEDSRSPLMKAISHKNNQCVEMLLSYKASPDASHFGSTALGDAVENQDIACIKLLLDAKATQLDAKVYGEKNDLVPMLFHALEQDNSDIVKLLLDAKASPNIHVSICNGFIETTPLIRAVRNHKRNNKNTTNDVRMLLQAKALPEFMDSQDQTPLMHACSDGNLEMVKLLLEANASPNQTAPGGWGLPLHCAYNDVKIARCLLDNKADVNLKVAENWTPLRDAVSHLGLSKIDLLLEYKADLELLTNDNKTALDHAVEKAIDVQKYPLRLVSINRQQEHLDEIKKFISIIKNFLSHGAKVHDFKKLFELIRKCDQNHPDLLSIAMFMRNQIKQNPEIQRDAEWVAKVDLYINELKKLNGIPQPETPKTTVSNDSITKLRDDKKNNIATKPGFFRKMKTYLQESWHDKKLKKSM